MLNLHEGLKYATLFDKESSSFDNVEFPANKVDYDEEKWIVFPMRNGGNRIKKSR